LFIGDVGRPDLLASRGVTADELAAQLYVSVHDKLLNLPDATRVFPGHGAGSACGKSLSTETTSTMGEQRATNYALAPMTADQFIAVVTEGQSTPPAYFPYDAQRNRQDRPLLDESTPLRQLSYGELVEERAKGAVVLDTRDAATFGAGHLVGSINTGADGRFAEYVGSVIAHDTPIVMVCEPGGELDARNRLSRIGFDNVVGVLAEAEAVFLQHDEEVAQSSRLSATELARRLDDGVALTLVDIRGPGEVAEVPSIPGALTIPLAELRSRVDEIDRSRPVVVYCAGGYRSAIASSFLAAEGFNDVSDLLGGVTAWDLRPTPSPASA
jgi:rhodanese-related sulfurtransferase